MKRLLVLDDEHRGRGSSVHPALHRPVGDGRSGPGPDGDAQRERGARALLRLDRDLAAVVGGDVAHDGEAEAGAAGSRLRARSTR